MMQNYGRVLYAYLHPILELMNSMGSCDDESDGLTLVSNTHKFMTPLMVVLPSNFCCGVSLHNFIDTQIVYA
jgi:hypothetical protein